MAVHYEESEKIVTITIDRPDALNSIDPLTAREFSDALIKFRDSPDAWVGIITACGDRAFCAGADLKTMVPAIADGSFVIPPLITRGLDIWKPIIAAINGMALGGGMEIAMACDIIIAAENATFQQPEVKWAVMAGWGATQRLPRFVSRAKAAEMLLMGNAIDANEAYRIGLVNKVVPLEQLMPTAREWAAKICKSGPLAVRATKEAMLRGFDMGFEDGLLLEKNLAERMLTTEDYEEGLRAFNEKRKPQYKAK